MVISSCVLSRFYGILAFAVYLFMRYVHNANTSQFLILQPHFTTAISAADSLGSLLYFCCRVVLCEVTKCHKRIQFEIELAYARAFSLMSKPPAACAHSYIRVAIVAFRVTTRRASLCVS